MFIGQMPYLTPASRHLDAISALLFPPWNGQLCTALTNSFNGRPNANVDALGVELACAGDAALHCIAAAPSFGPFRERGNPHR